MKTRGLAWLLFFLVLPPLSAPIAQRESSSPSQAGPAADWTTYSGTGHSHRFSPLTQISTENVSRLRPVWMYQPPGTGPLEGTPIVANGVMYVTSGPATVVALRNSPSCVSLVSASESIAVMPCRIFISFSAL